MVPPAGTEVGVSELIVVVVGIAPWLTTSSTRADALGVNSVASVGTKRACRSYEPM